MILPKAHITHECIKLWKNQVVFDAEEKNSLLSEVLIKIVIKSFESNLCTSVIFVQVTESDQTIHLITDKPPTNLF